MIDPQNRFTILRSDRHNRVGGGVCALIPGDIRCIRHVEDDDKNKLIFIAGIDFLTFDISTDGFKYSFFLVYRPPFSGILSDELKIKTNAFLKILNTSVDQHRSNFILGDFNIPLIDWENSMPSTDYVHSAIFNCFADLGLVQFVRHPTHFNKSGNHTVLDLILSNNYLNVNINDVIPPLSTSDHGIVDFYIFTSSMAQSSQGSTDHYFSPVAPSKLSTYDWKNADFLAMNNQLLDIDWHAIFGYNFHPDALWSSFKAVICPIISSYVPCKPISFRNKYKIRQYPKNIRNLLSRKAAIWRILKTSNTSAIKSKYSNIANECRLAICKFDAEREEKILEANNLGTFYKFVNGKLGNPTGTAPLRTADGILHCSDSKKATILNEYFHSVYTTDDGNLPHFPSRLPSTTNINDVKISPQIIAQILNKLKSTSPGPDNIPPIFYKQAAVSMAFPLSILFRTYIDLHEIPSEWKLSIITPKFKKGLPSDPSNYRPISLTCTCCKIMESIITSELLQYLSTHNLISKNQHGFLKKHSTNTNLLESLNDWSISLSNHKSVTIAYIDFQRAFDVISHRKLLHKLSSYGISGNLLFWIQSFLLGRYHSVKLNTSLSSFLPVLSGIPQGSVLGPLLFNLFINDISDGFGPNISFKLFADDLKIYTDITFPSDITTFQFHLDKVQQWSNTWQINISYKKCNILFLGKTTHLIDSHKLNFSDNLITQTDSVTDLGVIVEHNLKFKIHISTIISKAKQRSSLIFRCFLSRTTTNLIKAYITYIRPMVEYASTVWSPSQITLINALESVQKNFTKRLPGFSNLPYNDRLKLSKLQSLEHRRLLADLAFCYSIINGLSSIPFNHFFSPTNNPTSRGHPLRLALPLPKLETTKSFFTYRVIIPWNSLPPSIVLAPTLPIFKSKLRNHDLSKFLCFPTIY